MCYVSRFVKFLLNWRKTVWFKFVRNVVVTLIKFLWFRCVTVVLFVRLLSARWRVGRRVWLSKVSVINWNKIFISNVLLLSVSNWMIFLNLMIIFINFWRRLSIVNWRGILLRIWKRSLIACVIWVSITFFY